MTIHVVGAGLAGLAAAVRAVGMGRQVRLYEAAGQAGGRCRSFDDPVLGRSVDNGNHLLLSGNRSALAYLEAIGARDALTGPDTAAFPFLDLASGQRWRLRLNDGPVPFWPFLASRRVPGTVPSDYLALARLALARADATVNDAVAEEHPLHRALIAPLATAVLNARPEEGAAILFRRVVAETVLRGGRACRPLVARRGLDAAFVAPALAWLRSRGVVPRMNDRLRAFGFSEGKLVALGFADGAVTLARDDAVVLAVPPAAAGDLVPDLVVPPDSRAILNAHFRLPSPPPVDWAPFLGIVGGFAEWLFLRDDVLSVTVSAADARIDEPADDLARDLWHDVARALRTREPMPPVRIIKERRATFAQTPDALRLRPPPTTAWPNLFLAGDWTDTGLPATIEGAIRSGDRAADLALGATIREA